MRGKFGFCHYTSSIMYTTNPNPNKKSKPSLGYLMRSRLAPVRSFLSSRPIFSPNHEKKKKFKKSGVPKMEFRKKPDYADTAYREAVSRLRALLADSYTPSIRPLRELDSAGDDTDNQSVISTNTKFSKLATPRPYYQYLNTFPRKYYYNTPSRYISFGDTEKTLLPGTKIDGSCNAAPPELMSFIEKQEDYIQQLEKESRFCREELTCLLSKVKDVISENENLHEKQKSNLMKSMFNHLETETETETEADSTVKHSLHQKSSKKSRVLEGPTIVFESRISELEAQLTQAKIDLRKALDENENIRKKINDVGYLDATTYEGCRKQIEALQKEKETLQETVTKLQFALAKIRDKENETCDQVKRSLDVAEQAQYEKNAAEMEIRRLKDELERQHQKLRDAISEQSRRISDERAAVERRYTQQIEQLTGEVGIQWETTNKLQLELDKQRRENADLRRELAQKQALLDEIKKETQNKIMCLQSDIGVTGAEKGALEQQIASLQMLNERNERQTKQETSRLQAEIQSLRQRLDRADADLIHSRRENLRLSEQVASLEKEIRVHSVLNETNQKTNGEVLALPPPKDKDFSNLIQDMESKHATTVAELEGMIHSQNQLMDKLSVECHALTQKLEESSTKHKEELRQLQTSLNRLNYKVNQSQINSPIDTDERHNTTGDEATSHKTSPVVQQSKNAQPDTTEIPKVSSRRSSQEKTQDLHWNSNKSPKELPLTREPSTTQEITAEPEKTKEENEADEINYDQTYDPNQYDQPEYDYTNQGQYDPNQANEMYATGDVQYAEGQDQYDDQQYMTQYATNPDQQYETSQNQLYSNDPDQQYDTDINQDYSADPNQDYTVDPNQDYSVDPDPNQQYEADPKQPYPLSDTQYYQEK